jgi:hypothetical protein
MVYCNCTLTPIYHCRGSGSAHLPALAGSLVGPARHWDRRRHQFCEFRPEGPLSGFASEHRRVVRNRNLLLALFLVRGGALGLRGLEAYP